MSDDKLPDAPPEWSDSDQRWFDVLTGQREPSPDDPKPEEVGALLMREAYLREQAREAAEDEALAPLLTDEARRARKADVMAHLQAQGLIAAPPAAPVAATPSGTAATTPARPAAPAAAPPPTPPAPARTDPARPKPWWRFLGLGAGAAPAWPRAAGAFAVLALVLVTGRWALGPDYPQPDEDWRPRGELVVIARTDVQPRRAAEALAQRLQAGGVRASIFQIGKVYLVQVTVLDRDLPGVETVLTQQGLPARPGDYRVEYRAP